MKPSFDDA